MAAMAAEIAVIAMAEAKMINFFMNTFLSGLDRRSQTQQSGLLRQVYCHAEIEYSLVTQGSLVAAVRLKITAPVHADHFQREPVAVHCYQHVMISALARLIRRFGDAVERDFLVWVVFDVIARVGITGINVERRAASASDDLIEPVWAGLVYVMLHPMLEEMFVAREVDSDVMFVKERHVFLPDDRGRRFDLRPAVRPRREGRMMAVNDHIPIPVAIEPFELRFDPLELFFVARDVRIEGDEKGIAVAERKSGIAGQPPRRTFWRDQLGVRRKEVFQSGLPFRIVMRLGAGDVVIADGEEIRHVAFLRQPVDQVHKARVPLPPDRAVGYSVSGLNHETNRKGRLFHLFDRGDCGVDDQRMFVLRLEAVTPPARVSVDDEGETIDAG